MTSRIFDPLTLCACLAAGAILAARILLADAQLDWDEELYFQIASRWDADLLPYRDIFDHKQPLVYLYIKLLTGWGQSLAVLRIAQALILLVSLISLARALRGDVNFLVVPFLFALLSMPPTLGTNSEILYIPFVLLALAFALEGRVWLTALMTAIAVSLKVTVALDLLGVFIFFLAIRGPGVAPLLLAWRAIGLFAVVQAALFGYFWLHGVDLFAETVARNLAHAAGRDPAYLPRFFLLGLGLIGGLLTLRLLCEGRFVPTRPALALILWALLSVGQAMVTGKYYYHYFIPIFIPLSILMFWGDGWRRSLMPRLGLGAVILGLGVVSLGHASLKLDEDAARRAALQPYCGSGEFHYHGDYLAIYRLCETPGVSKFMYPRFYETPHFIGISGSGGRAWACALSRPVIVETAAGITTYEDGADWCARGEVAEVKNVNSSLLKKFFNQIRNGETGG